MNECIDIPIKIFRLLDYGFVVKNKELEMWITMFKMT